MKAISIAIFLLNIFSGCLFGQEQTKDNNIKLFVGAVDNTNKDLSETLKAKLNAKLIQLVNQTGVAEVGYSNFLLYPEFYVNNSEVSETGLVKLTVVNCDLNLFIARILPGRNKVAAGVFASFNKVISGSGNSKEAAINNAINSLSGSDKSVVDFINKAKAGIADYYTKNCNEVLEEADRMYHLDQYAQSIAMYFAIPTTAPCYDNARSKSILVYKAFLNNQCKEDLIALKAILATASNNKDVNATEKYDKAIEIFKRIDPTTSCYDEALNMIKTLEAKFEKAQQDELARAAKRENNETEMAKEYYKAMGRMASNAAAAPANNVVFIKSDK